MLNNKVMRYIIAAVYAKQAQTFTVNATSHSEALAKARSVAPSALSRSVLKVMPL